MKIRTTIRLVFFIASNSAFTLTEAASPAVSNPASNPYASIAADYTCLSSDDLEALRQGRAVSAEAIPILAKISSALSAGRQTPEINWGDGTSDEDSARSTLKAFRIAPLALSYSALLEPQDAATIGRTVMDLLALGRHVGRDGAIIHWMNEMSIEQKTADWLAARLLKFTPEQAGNLIKDLSALPPGGDLATALAADKAYYLDPVLDDVRLLLADEETPSSPTAELRMAGIILEGPITSVGVELPNRETFWLKPGQTKRGVTLLSVNPSLDDAFLLHEKRILRLHLKSRALNKLSPEKLRERWDRLPAKSRLRAMADESAQPDQALVSTVNLLTMMNDFYADVLANPVRYRDQRNQDERVAQVPEELRAMAPVFVFEILKAADRTEVVRAQLSAALTACATGDALPKELTDPISNRPMKITPAHGGYLIESDSVFRGNTVRLKVGLPSGEIPKS